MRIDEFCKRYPKATPDTLIINELSRRGGVSELLADDAALLEELSLDLKGLHEILICVSSAICNEVPVQSVDCMLAILSDLAEKAADKCQAHADAIYSLGRAEREAAKGGGEK